MSQDIRIRLDLSDFIDDYTQFRWMNLPKEEFQTINDVVIRIESEYDVEGDRIRLFLQEPFVLAPWESVAVLRSGDIVKVKVDETEQKQNAHLKNGTTSPRNKNSSVCKETHKRKEIPKKRSSSSSSSSSEDSEPEPKKCLVKTTPKSTSSSSSSSEDETKKDSMPSSVAKTEEPSAKRKRKRKRKPKNRNALKPNFSSASMLESSMNSLPKLCQSSPIINSQDLLLGTAATSPSLNSPFQKLLSSSRAAIGNRNANSNEVLKNPPAIGSRIAFKLLEMDADYCPTISKELIGVLVSIDGENVSVKIDGSDLAPTRKNGKFELNGSKDHEENSSEHIYDHPWKDLIDPRLL